MRYKTKAQWAAAKAAELRNRAAELRGERVPSSDWRGVQSKMRILASIDRDTYRFETMAERFRAQGM